MTENNIKLYPYYSILVLYIKFEIFLQELLVKFFSFFRKWNIYLNKKFTSFK